MSAIRVPTALVPIVMSACLLGCGTGGPKKLGKNPAWRTSGNVEGSRDGERAQRRDGSRSGSSQRAAQIAPVEFAPAGQGVSFYNDPPIEAAPSDPVGDAIVAAIADFYTRNGGIPPQADGRLYKAARELAAIVPERDSPLPYPVIEFALQRNGIIEPSPSLAVVWGRIDDPGDIVPELVAQLGPTLAAENFARIGIGSAVRNEDGEGATIVALQSSHLTTKPIPRALPKGGRISLSGTIFGAFKKPKVFVTREDGSVEEPKMKKVKKTKSGQSFRAKVSCNGHRGRQQIEITATGDLGSKVLANFPVWCNERAPVSVTVQPSLDDTVVIETAAQAEALMLELVNRDRKKHGLPAVSYSAEAAAVARAHSREMRDTGVVAHRSPTTGEAADRVRTARIRHTAVLENLARAYGVAEAQNGLMNSPGHRANVLSDLPTHAGIGIIFGDEVAGRREMFVTQLFVRVPPAVSPSVAKKRVHAILRSSGRLASDPALAAVAQEAATALAAGNGQKKVVASIQSKVGALAGRFSQVITWSTVMADVASLDAQGVLKHKESTHYGLGVAKGNHDEMGKDALFVVVLAGKAR